MKLIEGKQYMVNGQRMTFLRMYSQNAGRFQAQVKHGNEITSGVKDEGIRVVDLRTAEITPVKTEISRFDQDYYDGCTDAFGMCYSDADPGL